MSTFRNCAFCGEGLVPTDGTGQCGVCGCTDDCDSPPPNSGEAVMIVLRRDETGKATVWCDPDIADIVKALIDAGLTTVASCSGHGHQPGSVILNDGREVRVFTFEQARVIDKAFPGINGEPLYMTAIEDEILERALEAYESKAGGIMSGSRDGIRAALLMAASLQYRRDMVKAGTQQATATRAAGTSERGR